MYNNLEIQINIINSKQHKQAQKIYIGEEEQTNEQQNILKQNIPTSFFIVVSLIMLSITGLSFANKQLPIVQTVRGAEFYEDWDYQVCIIIQHTKQSNDSFMALVDSLQQQTYKDWKAFYYINASDQQHERRSRHIKSMQMSDRVTILPSYPNAGMNYFDGFNNQCDTHSLVIILDEGDKFYSQTSLYQIRKLFQTNDHIYLLASSVELKGNVLNPNALEILNFQRFKYFIPNKTQISTAQQIFANISTHVKAFKVHFYKDIMPYDLMSVHEQFYASKAAFLFPLLQMCTRCYLGCYFPDTSYSTTDQAYARMPNIIKITNQVYFSSNNSPPILDQGTSQVYKKQAYQSLAHKYSLADRWMLERPKIIGQQIKKGELNLLKRNFTKQKKLIPKNINQFWLNYGQLPPFKKKLMEIVKKKHEGYFYKLWTLEDINKQNFPLTFDILTKLLNLDKRYGYTRMSMIADLMRLQVLYHHGGFHCDLNYEVFKSYDQFRHFPLLIQTQEPFFTPDAFSMGLFGAKKGSQYIEKLLTPESLAQISLKGLANIETGPKFFAGVITPEDFYLRIKVIPAQLGNVFIPWANDVRFQQCKCRFRQKIPAHMEGKYIETIEFEGGITVLPCDKMYPGTFGMDHFYTGGSWSKKKLINSIIV